MNDKPALGALVIGVGAPTATYVKGGGHQIGYTHAAAYAASGQVRLEGAADIRPHHLDAFLAAFPGPEGFSDYRTALRTLKPDIVSICTYVGLHREMIEACVEAGVKGILCEKPFVNSPRDLAEVEALVAGSGVKVVVAHIRRYLPAYIKARQLVESGAIGSLTLASVGLEGWDLSEMGSHYFDLMRMFAGDQPARHVFGQARVRQATGYGHAMEDHAIAYFEFADGARGLIDGGRGLGFSLLGSEGLIRLDSEQAITLINRDGEMRFDYSQDPASGFGALFQKTVEDLAAWVHGGPEPEIGLASSARTAELNFAAYLSVLRGDRVDLPLDDAMGEWPVDALARRTQAEAEVKV